MSNISATLDIIPSFISYVLDTKPFHTKLVDIEITYLYNELVYGTIKDTNDITIQENIDYSVNPCLYGYDTGGFGEYCGYPEYRYGLQNPKAPGWCANGFDVKGFGDDGYGNEYQDYTSPTIISGSFTETFNITEMLYYNDTIAATINEFFHESTMLHFKEFAMAQIWDENTYNFKFSTAPSLVGIFDPNFIAETPFQYFNAYTVYDVESSNWTYQQLDLSDFDPTQLDLIGATGLLTVDGLFYGNAFDIGQLPIRGYNQLGYDIGGFDQDGIDVDTDGHVDLSTYYIPGLKFTIKLTNDMRIPGFVGYDTGGFGEGLYNLPDYKPNWNAFNDGFGTHGFGEEGYGEVNDYMGDPLKVSANISEVLKIHECITFNDEIFATIYTPIPVNTSETSGTLSAKITAVTYTQDVPSNTWVITHNLAAYPIVRVFVDNSEVQPFSVQFPDLNTVVISFTLPLTGIARCI